MTEAEGHSELVAFLEEEVGDGLRAVVVYTPEAAEVLELRADLQGEVNLEAFETTVDQARTVAEVLYYVGELQGETLGQPVANAAVFEHTIVFQLPLERGHGVLVTLERDVGRDLSSFVDRCRGVLVGALEDDRTT